MRSVVSAARPATVAATRIVCFPGAYHSLEDFFSAGFDSSLRRLGATIDLQLVDVEMQHLGDRTGLERLKDDVVLPARAQGVKTLWFAGVSLGGFVAMDYAAAHPGDVDGICLLAPYLGNRMLTAEIAAAPGLANWNAHTAGNADSSGSAGEADEERRVWRFIQAQPAHSRLLYLGFGCDDRFAAAHRLMAEALPPDAVDVIEGGHDWRTWSVLWENFLQSRFA